MLSLIHILLKPDRTPFISLYCAGFPYVGIWSKGEADFVCIEPWYGRTDNDGFTGDLKEMCIRDSRNSGCPAG